MTDQQTTDIAVIGGGLCGLIAAGEAAKLGARVVLVERSTLGGRARSQRTSTGFCLNQGPHALYVNQALHRVAASWGIDIQGEPPELRNARGLANGAFGKLPIGPRQLLTTKMLSIRAKAQLGRRLATLQRLRPADFAHLTIDQTLDTFRLPPDARAATSGMIRLTTFLADHDLASGDAAISQLQLGADDDVVYLDDGWQQLVDAMTDSARDAGVDIWTQCSVRQIEPSADETTVRFDDGQTCQAAAVIIAGLAPRHVASLVVGGPDLSDAAGPPVTAATLDLGVRHGESTGLIVGFDEPLYLSRHSPPANLAPTGYDLLAAMRYLRHDETHDHAETARRLQRLAHQAGINVEDLVEERYSHRLVVAHGQPLAARGGMAGRPGVDALGIPGVFVAGDWIGSEGLLADASAASAVLAARHASTMIPAPHASAMIPAGTRRR